MGPPNVAEERRLPPLVTAAVFRRGEPDMEVLLRGEWVELARDDAPTVREWDEARLLFLVRLKPDDEADKL